MIISCLIAAMEQQEGDPEQKRRKRDIVQMSGVITYFPNATSANTSMAPAVAATAAVGTAQQPATPVDLLDVEPDTTGDGTGDGNPKEQPHRLPSSATIDELD